MCPDAARVQIYNRFEPPHLTGKGDPERRLRKRALSHGISFSLTMFGSACVVIGGMGEIGNGDWERKRLMESKRINENKRQIPFTFRFEAWACLTTTLGFQFFTTTFGGHNRFGFAIALFQFWQQFLDHFWFLPRFLAWFFTFAGCFFHGDLVGSFFFGRCLLLDRLRQFVDHRGFRPATTFLFTTTPTCGGTTFLFFHVAHDGCVLWCFGG